VLRALRDIDGLEDVPVVALTAHALPGDRERLLQHGFDAFLAKPFTKHEFFRMLRALR
jgi:CheY-like chemotaxis protein